MHNRTGLFGTMVFVAIVLVTDASQAGQNRKQPLRTTHVTLYDCGFAQLERQTEVRGARKIEIGVSLAHLDDLLASLVLATDDKVKVKGVNYQGVQNIGQAVAASGLANALSPEGEGLEMPSRLRGYVEALIGTRVLVTERGGRASKGTVLACVDRAKAGQEEVIDKSKGTTVVAAPEQTLVLVTPDGALVWISLDRIVKISPASKREATAIGNFATQLGKANGFTETAIVLETTADSMGKLAASYIRQIPLWRMQYRMTTHEDHVWLEAWAVVHNDTTETWDDVEMTLLSGLPKSYVLSMASPRYAEREGLQLEDEGNMMPQLGAHTADSLLYDFQVGYSFGYGGLSLKGSGRGGGGSGEGTIGLGSLNSLGHGAEAGSSLLRVGETAVEEQMEAQVEGEISTYSALNKVTVPAGTSSMVPVMRRKLGGRAFTLLRDDEKPSTCVRIDNETGLVLQGGLASFYMNGRFRGQTELERTEPGDTRILCFGEDPDVSVSKKIEVEKTYDSLEWRRDRLWVHNLKRTITTHTVENSAGQSRRIAIDVRHIENGRVVSPGGIVAGEEDNQKLFLFDIPERSEHVQRIIVEEGVMSVVETEMTSLEKMSHINALPEMQRAVLEKIVEAHKEAEKLNRRAEITANNKKRSENIVARLRETMKSVPQMSGNVKRVDKKVNEILGRIMNLETRIDQLQSHQETLRLRAKSKQKSAAKMLKTFKRSK